MRIGRLPIHVRYLFLVLAVPAAIQAQFIFTTNNSAITITGYVGSDSAVAIPDSTNSYPVTTIGSFAVTQDTNLTSVTIPNSVTTISDNAFANCYQLASLAIPDSVTTLGNYVCLHCFALTNVSIGNGIINLVGDEDFGYCTNLAAISIGTNLASFGPATFLGCNSLTSISLPKSLLGITLGAFTPCTGLTNISVDAANPYILSTNGVVFSKDMGELLLYPGGLSGTYTVPAAVTNIYAYAFTQCSALTGVTIPKGVLAIGNNSLQACPALTNITVNSTNPTYSSLSGVLFNKNQTVLIQYPGGKPGAYTIPNTVTNLGTNSFLGSAGLTSLIIPSNTAVIRYGALSQCTNLSSLIISNGVSIIEAQAFAECSALSNIVIPSTVTNIGFTAFESCPNLATIFFSGNAPSAGSLVFQGDTDLTVSYLPGTSGWGSTYIGIRAVQWNASIPSPNASLGVKTNHFGFNISGSSGIPVVIQACTNLANPVWQPVQTATLSSSSIYFNDSQWTNHPGRYYRLRSP